MIKPIKKRLEVILHRCGCTHCDVAEKEMGRLSMKYDISLSIRHVESEIGMKEWAGWKTPAVEVGGKLVTQYEITVHKWEDAIKKELRSPELEGKKAVAEEKGSRAEVRLYRCRCKHCDAAEQELGHLALRYGAKVEVKYVDQQEGLKDLAGWKTPIVEVNGKMVTHYEINAHKWEEAIQ